MIKKGSLITILSAVLLAGCQMSDSAGPDAGSRKDDTKARVEFNFTASGADESPTRSSFTWDDSEIRDVELIAVDDDGVIQDIIYIPHWEGRLVFTGSVGEYYTFYALANLGEKVSFNSAEEMSSYRRSVSMSVISASGIPMACTEGIRHYISEGRNEVTIPLTRMLARIDFMVDTSLLRHADDGGFKVKSVKIYNAINSYLPFSNSVMQDRSGSIEYSFDKASSQDITSLNKGFAISLYAFENMQGTLLPENDDPWKKVPAQIGAADYCSYIEASVSYSSKGLRYDDIVYRMYLGNDATSNFDVRRNTIYKLILRPTEDEMDGHRSSWKVVPHGWDDARTLEFIPQELTVPSLGSATAGIQMTPEAFELVVRENGWLNDASCIMDYDHVSQTLRITNTETLEADMKGTVVANSWDGALSDVCHVTVKAPVRVVGLRFTESHKDMYVNGPNAGGMGCWEPEVIATFSDGSSARIEAVLNSSDSAVATVSDGQVEAVGKGTAYISATYTDRGRTIRTEEPAVVSVTDPLLMLTAAPQEILLEIADNSRYNLSSNMEKGNLTVTAVYPSGDKPLKYKDVTWSLKNQSRGEAFALGKGLQSGSLYVYKGINGSTATLVAEYSDEGITKSAEIGLKAFKGKITSIYVTPDNATLKVGDQVGLKLYGVYDTGSTSVITGSATWKTDNDCVSTSFDGYDKRTVTGLAGGKATVSASYSGFTATASITVIQDDVISHELVISPSEGLAEVNDEVSFKATFFTLTNGIRDGGRDVTGSAEWSIHPETGARIDKGKAAASSEGTFTITCNYSGEEATATLKVTRTDVITHELVLSQEEMNMTVGDSESVKATWYTLTNGRRDEGTDVTTSAAWKSSDDHVASVAEGLIQAISAGQTTVTATFSGKQASVKIAVTEPDAVMTAIEVSPNPVELEKNGSVTMTVSAIWSDGSKTVIPNNECDWELVSGSSFFTLSEEGVIKCIAAGSDGAGKATLKSDPDLSDSFDLKCTTVLSLEPGIRNLDTWGGNSYPMTFTFDDEKVDATLTSVSYTGGAPSGLISFNGGKIEAKDWWGMSGAWINASPTYTATFTYNGYQTTVTGTMHGTTGFKDVVFADAYYSDIRTTPVVTSAYLTGSDIFDIKSTLQLTVIYDSSKQLNDGYLMVGSYGLEYDVIDPTNGLLRHGKSSFKVLTNVVKVFGTVTVSNNSYVPYNDNSHYVGTETDGGNMGRIIIYTNGHDETLFTVKYELYYIDVHGKTHKATYPLNSPDYGRVPSETSPGGVVPMEISSEEYSINGFSFNLLWQGE